MAETVEIESIPVREIPAPEPKDLVFLLVYGAMRKGLNRHTILEQPDIDYIDTIVLPNYSLLDLGCYPAIIHARNNVKGVVCEMYKLPLSILQNIDVLEDCPDVFTRTKVPDMPNCYVYTIEMHEAYARKTHKINWLHDGDYFKHLNPSPNEQSVKDVEED